MLHLRPVTALPTEKAVWPEVELQSPSTAFSERPPLRQLVVAADAELIDSAVDYPINDLGCLVGLLSHDYITLLRYADDGPPDDVKRLEHPLGSPAACGWIEVGPEDVALRSTPVLACDGVHVTGVAMFGDFVDGAGGDIDTDAYADLDPGQVSAQRRTDAIAMRAAAMSGVHMFITQREYLHRVQWDLSQGVVAASPQDALDLVALYLRAQGVFISSRTIDGRATHSASRGLFYSYGARSLLPGWVHWRQAISQHVGRTSKVANGRAVEDRELLNLGAAAVVRLQRALEARDQVHRALNQPQHAETAELVLASLDVAMMMLMAGLDATARVAHRALGLNKNQMRSASWQSPGWLKEAAKKDAELAVKFDSATTWNGAALVVLSRLRNSIHGGPGSPLEMKTALQPSPVTLIEFLGVDTKELGECVDRLGGRDLWGMCTVVRDRVHFDPDRLIENLFAASVRVLDETMVATPMQRLSGVTEFEEPAISPTFVLQLADIRRLLAVPEPSPNPDAG